MRRVKASRKLSDSASSGRVAPPGRSLEHAQCGLSHIGVRRERQYVPGQTEPRTAPIQVRTRDGGYAGQRTDDGGQDLAARLVGGVGRDAGNPVFDPFVVADYGRCRPWSWASP